MARRVPVTNATQAINCLQEDGGVILSGFASAEEVITVNNDAAPYLATVAQEVQPPSGHTQRHSLTGPAKLERTAQRNTTMSQALWAQSDCSREMDAETGSPRNPQQLPQDHIHTLQRPR